MSQHTEKDSVQVVRATEADIELVAPLFDAYRHFYGRPSDLAVARAFITERLARNESVIFLALDTRGSAQPLGFTQLYPIFSSTQARRAWLLNDLFVSAEARRRGVGRALLERARQFGEETGAYEMMLQTAHDNTPAQALYTSLGWQRDDEYLTFMLTLS